MNHSLFHHTKREMGCPRCLKRSYAFQLDRRSAQMIEEANALTQENMSNVHMEFVEQSRLQCLLDRACTMQGNILLARDLLCLRNRAFNAIGDKVKLRLALFLCCPCLRLQNNHRPVGCRAIRKDPPILIVNLIEASVSHDNCATIVKRIAHHFIEMFPCASHPCEHQ